MESTRSVAKFARCASATRLGCTVSSMPIFQAVEAAAEGAAIRVRLRLDRPRALAWQVLDPVTGALLSEGVSPQSRTEQVDMGVPMPPEEGAYRVQVAPQDVPDRVVLIDASIEMGR